MIILLDIIYSLIEKYAGKFSVVHGRSDGQTEKKAQVTEQVSIEQKTKEIKERIALFKLKYAKDLYDDKRESNYSIIRSTREQVTQRERT